MPFVIRAPEARADLVEIGIYIGRDNPSAAYRLLDKLEEKFVFLAANPELGELRPDLAAGLRSFTAGNYVIFYRQIDDGIEVARVIHGARDIEALF